VGSELCPIRPPYIRNRPFSSDPSIWIAMVRSVFSIAAGHKLSGQIAEEMLFPRLTSPAPTLCSMNQAASSSLAEARGSTISQPYVLGPTETLP
jgi:hypothetical protein